MERSKEEDVFDYQIGLDEISLSDEDKHFFDIAGYLLLDDLLTPDQVESARQSVEDHADWSCGPYGRERLNVIELGGACEDAMALPAVLEYAKGFIWGRQYRLVASRAIFNDTDTTRRLKQGGSSDPRRFARYRCIGDGQFRCLMITCWVALYDTADGDGAFCAIGASHKANIPHPYENAELHEIAPLRKIALRRGSGVLFTENLSYVLEAPAQQSQAWLCYQYGPSYMVSWPGCEPSADLIARTSEDAAKSHLLLEPYYHPAGSQRGVRNEVSATPSDP